MVNGRLPGQLCPLLLHLTIFDESVVVGLLCMAYPDGCLHTFTFLPRLGPPCVGSCSTTAHQRAPSFNHPNAMG